MKRRDVLKGIAALVAAPVALLTKPVAAKAIGEGVMSVGGGRVVHTTYALGWNASMEMMQDDQHDIMDQMSRDLANAAADHRERLAWSLIDDTYEGVFKDCGTYPWRLK